MRVAAAARHLRPNHSVRSVCRLLNRFVLGWLSEAWPATMRIELSFRPEEFRATADAVVHPRRLLERVLSCEWPLRALLSRHVVLLRRELNLPLRLTLFYFTHRLNCSCGNRVRLLLLHRHRRQE